MVSSKSIYNVLAKDFAVDDENLKKIKQSCKNILSDVIEILDKNNIPYIIAFGSTLGAVRHKGFIPWDDDIDINIKRDDFDKLKDIIDSQYSDKYEFIMGNYMKNCPYVFGKVSKKGTKMTEINDENFPFELGLNIDVFPFDNAPKTEFARKFKNMAHTFCSKMASLQADLKFPSTTLMNIKKQNKQIGKYFSFRRFLGIFTCILPMRTWVKLEIMFASSKKETKDFLYGDPLYRIDKSVLYETITVPFEDIKVKIPKDYDTYLKNVYGPNYMQLPPEKDRESHLIVDVKY